MISKDFRATLTFFISCFAKLNDFIENDSFALDCRLSKGSSWDLSALQKAAGGKIVVRPEADHSMRKTSAQQGLSDASFDSNGNSIVYHELGHVLQEKGRFKSNRSVLLHQLFDSQICGGVHLPSGFYYRQYGYDPGIRYDENGAVDLINSNLNVRRAETWADAFAAFVYIENYDTEPPDAWRFNLKGHGLLFGRTSMMKQKYFD